jgi:putative RNA 2'-phosphotransferase
MIRESVKQRHEMQGKRIRAMYGHSLPILRTRTNVSPPATLFHGTSESAFQNIRTEGLKPMGRQQVHLSVDVETAVEVGRRKAALPVVVGIRALLAHSSGVEFYRGNEKVWLADAIPPQYVIRYERSG